MFPPSDDEDDEPRMGKNLSTNEKMNIFSQNALKRQDLDWHIYEEVEGSKCEWPHQLENTQKKDKSHYIFSFDPSEDSFWHGHYWRFEIQCSIKGGDNEVYPYVSPKVKQLCTIFHPNIDYEGNVCLGTIGKGWKSTTKLNDIHQGLKSMFECANPSDPLNGEASPLLVNDREGFGKKVKECMKGGDHFGHKFEKYT